ANFVIFEINFSISSLVSTTFVTSSDASLIVSSNRTLLTFGKFFVWPVGSQNISIRDIGHFSTAWRCRRISLHGVLLKGINRLTSFQSNHRFFDTAFGTNSATSVNGFGRQSNNIYLYSIDR